MITSDRGTPRECAEMIGKMAAKAFEDHQIQGEGEHEWRCHRRGTSAYSFRVLIRPGLLVFRGDLGSAMIQINDSDVLNWLRGAVSSPHYLLEKVTANDRYTFYIGLAVEVANRTDSKTFRNVISKLAEDEELNQYTWCQALAEASDVEACDLGDAPEGPSSRIFWMIEALRWFVTRAMKAGE